MRKLAVITSIVLVSSTVRLLAQDALSPELARLRTGYQAAVTKAVSPLTSTYRKELERLLDSFTRAGKLDQALQVKKEIESLDGASLARAEREGSPEETVPVTAPVTTIEGTTWVARTGFLERIEFRPNGAMTVTNRTKKVYTGWTYKQAQDGSLAIQVSGDLRSGTFRFTGQGAVLEGVFDDYKETFKLDTGKK